MDIANHKFPVDITSPEHFLDVVKKDMYIILTRTDPTDHFISIERIERDPQEISKEFEIKVVTYLYSCVQISNDKVVTWNISIDGSDDSPEQFDVRPSSLRRYRITVFDSFASMVLKLPFPVVLGEFDLLNRLNHA